ncbi:MAG: zinc ribbon domain-containing protein [Anaerolineaceae bacterium]|nr:zinc ribbon domain-containing protein [Anaerolineaceae bacterium]
MPLYEYQCTKCGHKFETLRSFSDADHPIQCSACLTYSVTRKISQFSSISDGNNRSGTSNNCTGCYSGNCASCH